jgi:rubrerythrin
MLVIWICNQCSHIFPVTPKYTGECPQCLSMYTKPMDMNLEEDD